MSLTLYSTLGCSLCDEALALLHSVQLAHPIVWEVIDIMDLPTTQRDDLAQRIPVLAWQNKQLNWPFSLGDIIRLLD